VELNETLMLPTLLWAETAATEYKNHRIWPLQFRELAALGAVVGKLIIGEDSARNDVISHMRYFFLCNQICSQFDRSAQKRRSASIANMN
jgi:hypothetical protein